MLYDVIFLVRLQGKFEFDHSWEWKDKLTSSKSTFSQTFKRKSIIDMARIGRMIIFPKGEKPTSSYCVVLYFWWGCRGNLKLIRSWEWQGQFTSSVVLWLLSWNFVVGSSRHWMKQQWTSRGFVKRRPHEQVFTLTGFIRSCGREKWQVLPCKVALLKSWHASFSTRQGKTCHFFPSKRVNKTCHWTYVFDVIQLVSVRRHGRVTQWKLRINFTPSTSSLTRLCIEFLD